MKRFNGFTLIELMVVIVVLGILLSLALPRYRTYMQRAEVTEAMSMGGHARRAVTQHYSHFERFPADNSEAGMPPADELIGDRIAGMVVERGAVHVSFGFKASDALQGKVLSFRPAVVEDSPSSPIAWLCGYDEPVPGMKAVGVNRTDLPAEVLPGSCRRR